MFIKMMGYDKVIVMTFILIFVLSDIHAICRKRCRENKPCGDGYVCKEDKAKAKRCYYNNKDYQCSNGSMVKECDCNYECSDSMDEVLCPCTEYSQEFVSIPGYFIDNDYEVAYQGGHTEQSCMDYCLREPDCVSCDLSTYSDTCFLSSISPAQDKDALVTTLGYILFVKKCKNCVK
ncbi:uncharacterized protein LOC123542874 isoform X2 [Mercenaria mercenaria]|uniref:uncharacterized protein LOC123542874 isoform X1 n=1 Tax=Mercenaria mercenaria TaxID=6596 RepID=UPI00234F83AF|nr:uncharacterized protein LOC123542874 isoform X1 [Mercenaria mercenaria]XP_053387409.1 uncharacterized protein LOC123542874 isoform X2 [Mercenaria mercenaria]